MGYLRAWKENVTRLAAVVLVFGLVAVGLMIAHKRNVARARAQSREGVVSFVVTGSAAAGVVVTEEEGGVNAVVLARRATLPFHARVSTADGSPSYAFIAQLRGAGRIHCTIRVGTVVEVRDAAGANGSCSPAVSWDSQGSRLGGGGWVAG